MLEKPVKPVLDCQIMNEPSAGAEIAVVRYMLRFSGPLLIDILQMIVGVLKKSCETSMIRRVIGSSC